MWSERLTSHKQPWLLCQLNIPQLVLSAGAWSHLRSWASFLESVGRRWGLIPWVFTQAFSSDPFFLCLSKLVWGGWFLLLRHSLVSRIFMNPQEYSFGILLVVFPRLCLLAAFPGALPALLSPWPSLCWNPYSFLNHFPSLLLQFPSRSIRKSLS